MSSSKSVVRIRSVGSFVASVPSLVGFVPRESLVGVFLSHGQVRVAIRLDLPAEVTEAGRHVASTGRRVEADEIVLVVYTARGDRGLPHRAIVDTVAAACQDVGVRVREALLVDGGRFWSYRCQGPACHPTQGTVIPDDLRLEAERVASGHRATASSREDLVAQYVGRPDLSPSAEAFVTGRAVLRLPLMARAEVTWDAVQVLASATRAVRPETEELLRARVVLAVQDVRVRDFVMAKIADEPDPAALVDAVVRAALTAPEDRREPVAAMAAALLAACGDSTVPVRCLLDLAGSQTLAALVSTMIEIPIPPRRLRALMVEALPQILDKLDTPDPAQAPTAAVTTPESDHSGASTEAAVTE